MCFDLCLAFSLLTMALATTVALPERGYAVSFRSV